MNSNIKLIKINSNINPTKIHQNNGTFGGSTCRNSGSILFLKKTYRFCVSVSFLSFPITETVLKQVEELNYLKY
jgi:hypothetical protein